MKQFFSFLILSILYFNAAAQSNFKSGYIVTNAGDSIKGYIDYREWNRNPKSIDFKVSNESSVTQYTPSSIKQFSVIGFEHYNSFKGKITMGMVELSNLSIGIDSSYVIDTIFLKTLAKGNHLTLYSYTDSRKSRLFVADGDIEPIELQRYVFLDLKQANREVELNNYRQQLIKFALKYHPGNIDLINEIQRLSYHFKSVQKVVELIDSTSTIPSKFNKNGNNNVVRFFVGASVNATRLAFSSDIKAMGQEKNIFQSNTSYWSAMPVIAGGVDVYFNKNVKKLLLRTELSLSLNRHNAIFKQNTKNGLIPVPREDIFSFNQLSISVNPQLLYNVINREKTKLYVSGGVQLNVAYYTNQFYTINWFYNDHYLGDVIGTSKTKLTTESLLFNATAKTGIIFLKKFDLFAAYSSPVIIVNDYQYTANLSSYKIGINYLFGQ